MSNHHTQIALGALSIFATIFAVYIFKKLRQEKVPAEWTKIGTLKEMYLYPLKSGKPLKIEKAFCTGKGLKEMRADQRVEMRDRSFVIYTSKDREVRTARQMPKTVLVEISPAQNGIILRAPNMTDLFIGMPKVKNNIKVTLPWSRIFGDESFTCTDCGESAAKWLSHFLTQEDDGMRLGYGDGSPFRDIVKDHHKFAEQYPKMDNYMTGIFSDLAALHLINQSSVDDLNRRLPEGEEKISVLNFRPNFAIEGPKAFEEDSWEWIKIGNAIAKVGLECLRCIETTVNSETGVRNRAREPLKTLESYRKVDGPFKLASMGIYLKVLQTGTICQGDSVYVSKTSS